MWTLTPTPTPTLTLTPTPGVVHKLFWTSSRRAKNDLWPYIKVLDDKNENCLWFELNLNTNCKKILKGAVYLPPEGSPYSSIDLFDKLEYDILNFTSESDSHLCLLGDFNARSGTLSDFTDIDENIADSLLDYESQFILSKNNLQDLGFPIDRYSNDQQTNNFGFRLIELCKSLLFMLLMADVG